MPVTHANRVQMSVTGTLGTGTPTSAHTYNGVWFDSKRQQIGASRVSKWVYDRAAG